MDDSPIDIDDIDLEPTSSDMNDEPDLDDDEFVLSTSQSSNNTVILPALDKDGKKVCVETRCVNPFSLDLNKPFKKDSFQKTIQFWKNLMSEYEDNTTDEINNNDFLNFIDDYLTEHGKEYDINYDRKKIIIKEEYEMNILKCHIYMDADYFEKNVIPHWMRNNLPESVYYTFFTPAFKSWWTKCKFASRSTDNDDNNVSVLFDNRELFDIKRRYVNLFETNSFYLGLSLKYENDYNGVVELLTVRCIFLNGFKKTLSINVPIVHDYESNICRGDFSKLTTVYPEVLRTGKIYDDFIYFEEGFPIYFGGKI